MPPRKPGKPVDDVMSVMAQDVAVERVPTKKEMETLSKMVNEANKLAERITKGEELLKELKAQHAGLVRGTLPELLSEIGVSTFGTKEGLKVELKSGLSASVSKDRMPDAVTWLEANGFSDIVKSSVSVNFGKGELKRLEKAMKLLEKGGFEPEENQSIHPQTLKAFVKERLEEGDNIPMDVFGVHEYKEVKITKPKE